MATTANPTTAHPTATEHLPAFITAPGETDVLMVVMAVILVLSVLGFGILFLRLHTLPERIAHKSHKLQFEIVAVLGLIALFTHMHIFWVAGLLLAMIDLPDFGTPLNRIAGSSREDRRPVSRAKAWPKCPSRRPMSPNTPTRRSRCRRRPTMGRGSARRPLPARPEHRAGEQEELIHA